MTLAADDGVLLVAHGTVNDLDDLPEFLARIRRGRPASAELGAELRRRYERIGGSPLNEITRRQGAALSRRLNAPVFVANRLWYPSVEQVMPAAAQLGVRRLCVLPLAPFSVHVYQAAARRAAEDLRQDYSGKLPELVGVEPWGTEPAFVRAHAAKINDAMAGWGGDAGAEGDTNGDEAALVLTAHSLPVAAITAGDPYEQQVRHCAEAIGRALGRNYRLAFQSQGADGGEWLGPDLKQTLRELRDKGVRRVVVAPFGFLAEHVETLYDLDIEAVEWARELGIEFKRVPALNDDDALIEALASVAERALSTGSSTHRA